jgi:uncharacterized protein YfbU (UPF0304 family)
MLFDFSEAECNTIRHALEIYEGVSMSKGMDRKKESKKKPAKTFDEKRAAKREKRANRR